MSAPVQRASRVVPRRGERVYQGVRKPGTTFEHWNGRFMRLGLHILDDLEEPRGHICLAERPDARRAWLMVTIEELEEDEPELAAQVVEKARR